MLFLLGLILGAIMVFVATAWTDSDTDVPYFDDDDDDLR
jgi:hypothetical protein